MFPNLNFVNLNIKKFKKLKKYNKIKIKFQKIKYLPKIYLKKKKFSKGLLLLNIYQSSIFNYRICSKKKKN